MFPNVRLMIVAMLASVVALVCGFGMFAVFRVSHEPFARSPAATASLRLVADNAAYSAPGLASSAPFDRRLQVGAEPSAAATTDMPEATEHEAETEASSAATPEPSPTASAESEEATEQPPAAVTSTSDAAAAAEPAAANDAANVASLSRPEAAPDTTVTGAGASASSPDATVVVPDQETKPPAVSMADAGPAFSAAAVAVNDPHDVPPAARERVNVTGPPSDDARPSGEGVHKAALKKPKRMRVAVRIRRVQTVAAISYRPTQFSQAQYTPVAEQNFGGTQINFQPTPLQSQYLARPSAPVRYVRLVARKPRATTQEANTATGGPFVSVTNR